jgi:hypothetical protein
MGNIGESMDRNRYTWSSAIGQFSKRQFLLLSLTTCAGATFLSTGNISVQILEIVLGFIVLAFSFQILVWRNDINNYLLFLQGTLNKNIRKTMNIYGEEVELRNSKDEKMERYLDIYGKANTKVKKIIGIITIVLLAFLIQYFILKEYSVAFYSMVGLGIFMASTSSYGELLIPIFLQLILVVFQIEQYDKFIFTKLIIYIAFIFLCISSQYLLETSFYRKSINLNSSFSKERLLKIMKAIAFFFFIIGITNHFLPGNTNWFKKLFKGGSASQKSSNNNSNKISNQKSQGNHSKSATANSGKQNGEQNTLSHDDYESKKEQRKQLIDLEKKIEKIDKNLDYSKNLIKHIATMKGFENIDLSSYVDGFTKKHNKLKNDLSNAQDEINSMKKKKSFSVEDLNKVMDKFKKIGKDIDGLEEYSKQFKSSKDDLKLPSGGTYKELEEMMKDMNQGVNHSKDSVKDMLESFKNIEEKNNLANKSNAKTGNQTGENTTQNPNAGHENQNDKNKLDQQKKQKKKKEEINWEKFIKILMFIFAFILLEKIVRLFLGKKIESKTEKRLKKAWTKNIKQIRKNKLDHEQEVIQTYNLLHSFLNTKHYENIGEEAPPALILYIDKFKSYKELDKQFYYITDLFMRCRYGDENVPLKDLKLFRKCVNYSWKRI